LTGTLLLETNDYALKYKTLKEKYLF